MRVAMIGSGYVGLVSGACFADFGHTVVCIDKDPSKIERLNRAEIPIFEPGLDDLVATNVRDGRLSFTQDGAEAIRTADAVFIAVGTPSRRGDGHADLSYVHQAARDVVAAIDGFTAGDPARRPLDLEALWTAAARAHLALYRDLAQPAS